MLTDTDAERAERLIADCTRVRIAGAGHLIHWLQIETTLRLVLSFLESIDAEGGR